MCGIVGVLDRRTAHSDDELLHLVRSMGMPMEWRGPDAAGAWVDAGAGIAIGHRRLKVLDLSESAAQPMVSGDGRLVLSFNGEIYNFVEIRDNLVAAGPSSSRRAARRVGSLWESRCRVRGSRRTEPSSRI